MMNGQQEGKLFVQSDKQEFVRRFMICEKSCGAVLYYEADRTRVYLVEKMLKGHQSLCKGHVEGNETEHETAAREILEETNLKIRFVDGFREYIEYSPYSDCLKEVVFFLAKTESMNVFAQPEEVSSIFWLSFEEALESLTYESDRAILHKADDYLNQLAL